MRIASSIIYDIYLPRGSLAFTAPVAGNVYNPGEAPYPHLMSLQDKLGEIRGNPTSLVAGSRSICTDD